MKRLATAALLLILMGATVDWRNDERLETAPRVDAAASGPRHLDGRRAVSVDGNAILGDSRRAVSQLRPDALPSPQVEGLPPEVAIGEPLTGMRGDLPDTASVVSGKASWYCGAGSRCTSGYPASGLYAAAGPALRVGDWRGRIVRVCSAERCTTARLIDACWCTGGRVIDLYRSTFSRLADPSRGVIRVTVSWSRTGPVGTLPPTETVK